MNSVNRPLVEVGPDSSMTEIRADRNLCSMFTCVNDVYAKKLCQMHYRRQHRHGSPYVVNKPGRKPKNQADYVAA